MNNPRCVNLACVCNVAMLGDACTEKCSSAPSGAAEEIICHCGHPGCAREMKEELGEGAPAS